MRALQKISEAMRTEVWILAWSACMRVLDGGQSTSISS